MRLLNTKVNQRLSNSDKGISNNAFAADNALGSFLEHFMHIWLRFFNVLHIFKDRFYSYLVLKV